MLGLACQVTLPQPALLSVTVQDTGSTQRAAQAPVHTGHHWTGWYVGDLAGLSRGNATITLSDPGLKGSSNAFARIAGGPQFGYNRVLSSQLFLGAEADISFPNFIEDGVVFSARGALGNNVTKRIDFVSTVRGRVGFAANRWLIYGTGGFALSQARFIDSAASGSEEGTVRRARTGWALGAGAEFAIASDWAARIEYVYHRLGQVDATLPSGTGVASNTDVRNLQLGLSWMFNSAGASTPSNGPDSPTSTMYPRWNIHGQDTFIEQGYFQFRSPYEGTNSLSGAPQAKNTESATAFLGVRLWQGAALYFNPEIDQGSGLNTTHGVSAFPNGEAQKASFPLPRFVADRLFLRQTFGLGGTRETIADGPNQLAGTEDVSRITVVMGKLAVPDYFNGNTYANDPRTNFLNWNIYGAGAYDWTMDQISWTWGALAELNQNDWAFRVGYFLLPVSSSNNSFDTHIPDRGEYAAEVEWRYALGSQPGKLRVFGWVNHGTMGSYADALALPVTTPNYPDITLTRQQRTNPGVVINAEQAITSDLGLFSRASWSPGLVEILGGTDCSRSLSLGGLLKGKYWGRPYDNLGVSAVVGGLSPVARAYFAAGGLGILIGDGQLNYREEKGLEAYYAYAFKKSATISLDYQFIVNPGYNADRGPVSVYAARVHLAF
jgi:high affinity Mn2+ porin